MRAGELRAIHRELTRLGLSLATAESCTGGWIAKLFTDLPGSSKFFKGGVVVYSNAMKRKVLGVPIGDRQSAVTRNVAIAMAKHALKLFDADVAISTTGFMEPESVFSNSKITGVSYCCVAMRRSATIVTQCERTYLRGTRRQNRDSTSTVAVHLIDKILLKRS